MGYSAGEGVSFGLGQGNFDRIADTKTHVADYDSTGVNETPANTTYHPRVKRWNRIKALTACTFATGTLTEAGDTLANADVLPIGDELQGTFTSIKLSAGVLIAYRG